MTSGALLTALPVPWAITSWVHGGTAATPGWAIALLVVTTLLLLGGGIGISSWPRRGRLCATFGALGLCATAAPRLPASPGLTVLLATVLLLSLGVLWQVGASLFATLVRSRPAAGRVRGAAALALAFWLVAGVGTAADDPEVARAVAVAMGIAMAIAVLWLVGHGRPWPAGVRVVALGLVTAVLLATTSHADARVFASCGAIHAVLAIVFGPRLERIDRGQRWWATLLEHPERMLVSTFATLGALGALVLALPQSTTGAGSIGGIDAVFTAVSAACVTGLAVRDTAAEFTPLGQAAILLLMQLGGLGIMTFSTAALRVIGARMSLRQESAVAQLMGARDRGRLAASAQDVLRVTLLCEAAGAVVLTLLFWQGGEAPGPACWRGVFTAVSAFCNAGFALQSDSLMSFQEVPLVLHTVAALIVLGGLSPMVILALARRRDPARALPAQVRLCAWSAVILLFAGAAFHALCEWDRTLSHLPLGAKLHNAWFQSVTLRTAGFNSTDIAGVHPATWLMMIVMMFIGASPGGTAGGVKTTTVAVLLLSVVHTMRGSEHITGHGRRIPERTVRRAAAIVTIALGGVAFAGTALLLTQRIPLPEALFEVVSALGTVGLSQGATARLDDVGKVIVIACMFIGRIGGLSIMMFLSQRRTNPSIVLPTEDIDVG